MARRKKTTTAANIGYEAQLWQMADALRGSMDSAEYKHVVLGLLFLKYISDKNMPNLRQSAARGLILKTGLRISSGCRSRPVGRI